MERRSLELIINDYENKITKIGDLSLLSKVKKAQEESAAASQEARELYKQYIKSIK